MGMKTQLLKVCNLMIYPLDKRNTKKLKTKNQTSWFFCKHLYFSQFFSKKAKITISLFMKNSRNNNIILGFSIWFYVFGFSWSNALIKRKASLQTHSWVCSVGRMCNSVLYKLDHTSDGASNDKVWKKG